jgi:uncharacterized membrane protein YagU involved in acid resistance
MRAGRAILLGGIAAGVLDLTWALSVAAIQGRPPIRILHSIASGLLGKAAFQGGSATAAFGLILHFVIASSASAVYYLASRKIAFLRRQPLLAGPLFGILVYLVMYRIVVPLSAAPWKFVYTPSNIALALIAHVFCVGLPIALAIHSVAPVSAGSPRSSLVA